METEEEEWQPPSKGRGRPSKGAKKDTKGKKREAKRGKKEEEVEDETDGNLFV